MLAILNYKITHTHTQKDNLNCYNLNILKTLSVDTATYPCFQLSYCVPCPNFVLAPFTFICFSNLQPAQLRAIWIFTKKDSSYFRIGPKSLRNIYLPETDVRQRNRQDRIFFKFHFSRFYISSGNTNLSEPQGIKCLLRHSQDLRRSYVCYCVNKQTNERVWCRLELASASLRISETKSRPASLHQLLRFLSVTGCWGFLTVSYFNFWSTTPNPRHQAGNTLGHDHSTSFPGVKRSKHEAEPDNRGTLTFQMLRSDVEFVCLVAGPANDGINFIRGKLSLSMLETPPPPALCKNEFNFGFRVFMDVQNK